MNTAYIIDAVRTPRGKRNGSLAHTHPIDLAATPLKAIVDRNKIDPKTVDDVIFGCVSQRDEQDNIITRQAVLAAGFPIEVPGVSVNRFCGSGLTATNMGACAIMAGQQDLVITGGTEHMTRVPMAIEFKIFGSKLYDRYPNLVPQGVSAEMIAEQYGFTRGQVDEFSAESQRRAGIAWAEGRFDKGIVPVKAKTPDGKEFMFCRDEHMRPSTTVAALANLKPPFKEGGVIHAGNSSGIVDGAAALLLASKEACKKYNLKPRAKIVSTAVIGSDPIVMLLGVIPVTRKVLQKANLSLIRDIDLYEVNEAFAPVPMAWLRDLHSEGAAPERLNVNGGAIALGHPLGATGAILVGTALDELERRDKKRALITLCIGLGMAVATIIERV